MIRTHDPRWAVACLTVGLVLLVGAGSLQTGLIGAALGIVGTLGLAR